MNVSSEAQRACRLDQPGVDLLESSTIADLHGKTILVRPNPPPAYEPPVEILVIGPKHALSDQDFTFYVGKPTDTVFDVLTWAKTNVYDLSQRAFRLDKPNVDLLESATIAMQAYRLGNPLDDTTTLGPLVDGAALARVEAHVADALARGARLLCGGRRPEGFAGGFFYEPTLLSGCPDEALVMREETFGPVLPVRMVRDDAEALERMNDSRYGLTASVWTRDPGRAGRFARALEAGTIYQNRCDYLEPSLPWTGWKESGLGSTLSRYGFLHLTRRKSVHLRR